MGATNFTSHYDLPQFVANDKPSWLGDVNSAFLKIDTAVADASATAQSANSAATSAQTQVAGLTTQLGTVEGKANTALTTANSADGKATTAQTVAQAASVTAGEAKTAAQGALPLDGGTMTGSLVLSGAPTQELEAATKGYVDTHSGTTVTSTQVNTDTITLNSVVFATNAQIPDISIYNNGLIEFVWVATALASVSGSGASLLLCTIAGNPFNISEDTVIGYINKTDNWKRGVLYASYSNDSTTIYEQGITPSSIAGQTIVANSTIAKRAL